MGALSRHNLLRPTCGVMLAAASASRCGSHAYWAVSAGRRDAGIVGGRERVVQRLCGGAPSRRLPRSAVERRGDGLERLGGRAGRGRRLREVPAQRAAGRSRRSPRGRGLGGASDADGRVVLDAQVVMAGPSRSVRHRSSGAWRRDGSLPGERPPRLRGQRRDRPDDRAALRLGAPPGGRRAVPHLRPLVMAGQARQAEQRAHARGALDQRGLTPSGRARGSGRPPADPTGAPARAAGRPAPG
jgi:hypothetical protein